MADRRLIVVVGAGGHARVVAEAVGADLVAGHLAPMPGDHELLGPWLGDDDAAAGLVAHGHLLALGVGFVDRAGSERRARILERFDPSMLAVVVHPAATVAASASLAPGSFVAAGAVVGTCATVGVGVIVNTGAVVDHDCRLDRNVHIGPQATLSGGVEVGADTLVGVGATVRQGITIGANAVVGAGAVVLSDVDASSTVVGVPARAVPS